MGTTTTFRCAGESHPGRVRENNEDRFHLDPERGIFMVIDGVGGQAAGEKAAAEVRRRGREEWNKRSTRIQSQSRRRRHTLKPRVEGAKRLEP